MKHQIREELAADKTKIPQQSSVRGGKRQSGTITDSRVQRRGRVVCSKDSVVRGLLSGTEA